MPATPPPEPRLPRERSGDDETIASPPESEPRAATGIAGLDQILDGGLPRHSTYLVKGRPGSGKTTLGMQFVLAGAAAGERTLFLSTLETEDDLRLAAASHGWNLDGVALRFQSLDARQEDLGDQSVFHPAEVELPRLIEDLLAVVDEVQPDRLVIDSLTELRLLALDPRWYRRQVLALKRFFAARRCTVLLIDEPPATDHSLESLVRGVVELTQNTPGFGPTRRYLQVDKLRGIPFATGSHDIRIGTGGLTVYPRLVAAEHRDSHTPRGMVSTGLDRLDIMTGGGIDVGTSALLVGPSGAGKSLLASQFALAATQRGHRAAMYVFDERLQTLHDRCEGVGLPLAAELEAGRLSVEQIDPVEMTPGEFSHGVSDACVRRSVDLVVIDSLNGYVRAMPDERLLAVHLHELLSYLNQRGVTVVMVLTRRGLVAPAARMPFDVSYIADSVFLLQLFEFRGAVRKALSVYKRRSGDHEATIREFTIDAAGLHVGPPLNEFENVLSGTPVFMGDRLTHGTTTDDTDSADG